MKRKNNEDQTEIGGLSFHYAVSEIVCKRFFAVLAFLFFVVIFVLSFLMSKPNLAIIGGLLTYSGLLLIFYMFVIDMHYKELHQIATDKIKTADLKHYKENFKHNMVMVYISFFGVLSILVSGILDIINLNLGLLLLLDVSVFIIFAASIGIIFVLWYVITGKIRDAKSNIEKGKRRSKCKVMKQNLLLLI